MGVVAWDNDRLAVGISERPSANFKSLPSFPEGTAGTKDLSRIESDIPSFLNQHSLPASSSSPVDPHGEEHRGTRKVKV